MTNVESKENNEFTVNISGYERKCGNCTMCCQGWLRGESYEYIFTKNSPCHFLDTCGDCCTIYDMRPEVCQDFQCEWLKSPVTFPMWMKPELSNVIVVSRFDTYKDEEFLYWSVVECGKLIDSKVLNWIIQVAMENKINLLYEVNSVNYVIGSDSFREFMQNSNESEELTIVEEV